MWLRLVLLALGAANCCASGSDERPQIHTPLGNLQGVWMTSELGSRYASYLGVPFAQPPLGKLRFKEPEPIPPWKGVWDASTIAPQCLAFDHRMHPMDDTKIKGHEDCLYLNIYTPTSSTHLTDEQSLPVIVYIHAGAFMFGTSNQYGAKFISDRNIILVTINYRVGPLGFMSFGDEILPGNIGLKDQVEALRWVKKYIPYFGGDSANITLMGLSAGGSSVHFHYLSPLSKGLFSRGVSMSGTALCRWAIAENVQDKSQQIANALGCGYGSSEEKLDCLRSRPAQNIVALVEQMQVWQYTPFSPLGPIVERKSPNAFLSDSPINLLMTGNYQHLPWITGVTEAEGLYPAGTFVNRDDELKHLDIDFEKLAPFLLDFNLTVSAEEMSNVLSLIRTEYFNDQTIDRSQVKSIIKMVSDRMFIVDAQRAAELQALTSKEPVWFYKFSFRGEHSLSDLMTGTKTDYGVSHADDVSYFLNVTFIPQEVKRTGVEADLQRQMLDLWGTFAKSGIPTSPGVTWTRVQPGKGLDYLALDSTLPSSMKTTDDLGNARFWESLPFKESTQSVILNSIRSRDEL